MTSIGLQMFTVRKHMKTHQAIRSTLHKLQGLGIRHMEMARVKFTMEEAQVIAKTAKELGMTIGCTQIKYTTILKDFDTIVDIHRLWDCTYIAVSVLPIQYILKGEKGIRQFGKLLNNLGRRLEGKGLKLLFHHHNFEYARYGDRTGLELLMEITDPRYVNLMMDTYWTQRGGRNPVDQIHQFRDRIKVIHIRDYKVQPSLLALDFAVKDTEVGCGNLHMKGIVETAISHEIPMLSIEQATSKPFESVAVSVKNLQTMGFGDLF